MNALHIVPGLTETLGYPRSIMFDLALSVPAAFQLGRDFLSGKGCSRLLHTLAFRQPAHHASHSEQNHRSPRAVLIRVAK